MEAALVRPGGQTLTTPQPTVGQIASIDPPRQSLPQLEDELTEKTTAFYCYYCDKKLQDYAMVEDHVKLETHKNRSLLVGKRFWKHRPPCAPPPFKLCDG